MRYGGPQPRAPARDRQLCRRLRPRESQDGQRVIRAPLLIEAAPLLTGLAAPSENSEDAAG